MANKTLFVANLEPAKRSPGFKMRRMYFRMWGPKVRRFVDTYGAAERSLFLRLEADPNVRTYCEHAPSIDEYIHGKRLRHIFTFAVRYVDHTEELIELVTKRDLVPDHAGDMKPERWSDKCAWAEGQDFRCRFIVAGSAELKNHTLTENWAQILPHVQSGLEKNNPALAARIEGAVLAREVLTLSDLPRVFPTEEPCELHELLLVLLHAGRVRIDLTREAINRTHRVDPA